MYASPNKHPFWCIGVSILIGYCGTFLWSIGYCGTPLETMIICYERGTESLVEGIVYGIMQGTAGIISPLLYLAAAILFPKNIVLRHTLFIGYWLVLLGTMIHDHYTATEFIGAAFRVFKHATVFCVASYITILSINSES